MVVHMTYLQVWADMGILGLVGYVWLTWVWLQKIRVLICGIERLPGIQDRAVYFNAIFILFFFLFSSFFHPFSTEWSEWIAFVVALTLFHDVGNAQTATRLMVRK